MRFLLVALLPCFCWAQDPYGTVHVDNRNIRLTASIGLGEPFGQLAENKKVSGTNVNITFTGHTQIGVEYTGGTPWGKAWITKIEARIGTDPGTGGNGTPLLSWNILPPDTQPPGGGELATVHLATKTVRFASTHFAHLDSVPLYIKVYWDCFLPNSTTPVPQTPLETTATVKAYNRFISFATTVGDNFPGMPPKSVTSVEEAQMAKTKLEEANHQTAISSLTQSKTTIVDQLDEITSFVSAAHGAVSYYHDSYSNSGSDPDHKLTWTENGSAVNIAGRTVPRPNYVFFWSCETFLGNPAAAASFGIYNYTDSAPETWSKAFCGFEGSVISVLDPGNTGVVSLYDFGEWDMTADPPTFIPAGYLKQHIEHVFKTLKTGTENPAKTLSVKIFDCVDEANQLFMPRSLAYTGEFPYNFPPLPMEVKGDLRATLNWVYTRNATEAFLLSASVSGAKSWYLKFP